MSLLPHGRALSLGDRHVIDDPVELPDEAIVPDETPPNPPDDIKTDPVDPEDDPTTSPVDPEEGN